MASCKLCASLVETAKLQYNEALTKEHAQVHFRQLNIFDEGNTFDKILDQCFPKNMNASSGEHSRSSKYDSLVQCCRRLLPKKAPSQSGRILCKKCNENKALYSSDGSLHAGKAIIHVCSHLRLDLFACRICNRQFNTRSGISVHLCQSHRLKVSDVHYVSRLDDYIEEISSMIKECFSVEQTNISSTSMAERVFPNVKASDLGVQRQTLCHQLVKKFRDTNGMVRCHLCAMGIKCKNKQGFASYKTLRLHAFRHLQKPVLRCKVCSDVFSSQGTLVRHLRNVHSLPLANNYESNEDQFHDDIIGILRKCYEPDSDRTPTKRIKCEASAICKTTRGSNLTIERRMLCSCLCRKSVNQNGKIRCRLCGVCVKAKKNTSGSISSGTALRHALTHMKQSSLNRCKICSKTFLTDVNMAQHLAQCHALLLANNYECFEDQFHDDIVAVIRKCYDDKMIGDRTSGCLTEPRIRTPRKGSKLATERRFLCVRLIRKFMDRDGLMQCSLCAKRVRGAAGSTGYQIKEVMWHALGHTEKHFKRCKLCLRSFVTRPQISVHLYKNHGTNMEDSKYECLEDQYHTEIVEMIRQCFGNDEETE